VALVVSIMLAPVTLAEAFKRYPKWWVAVSCGFGRVVLIGQTGQRRLDRTPPGEVVARAMDAERWLGMPTAGWTSLNGLIAIVGRHQPGCTIMARRRSSGSPCWSPPRWRPRSVGE
jgi:ATP-binding cassette subfamily B protein